MTDPTKKECCSECRHTYMNASMSAIGDSRVVVSCKNRSCSCHVECCSSCTFGEGNEGRHCRNKKCDCHIGVAISLCKECGDKEPSHTANCSSYVPDHTEPPVPSESEWEARKRVGEKPFEVPSVPDEWAHRIMNADTEYDAEMMLKTALTSATREARREEIEGMKKVMRAYKKPFAVHSYLETRLASLK